MVIVKQFTAEFEVELASEFADTLTDLLRLAADVSGVVKTYPFHSKNTLSHCSESRKSPHDSGSQSVNIPNNYISIGHANQERMQKNTNTVAKSR